MSNFTYKTDSGLYDVELLNDEAKTTYNYLVEIDQEINSLNKRINVLIGARQAFTLAMNDKLDEAALVTEEE